MNDFEGPLIGWSLSAGLKHRTLDDLLSFPCRYLFKAVGLAKEIDTEALMRRVSEIVHRSVSCDCVRIRTSSTGKYASISFHLGVKSSDEIYQINQSIQQIPGMRYIL